MDRQEIQEHALVLSSTRDDMYITKQINVLRHLLTANFLLHLIISTASAATLSDIQQLDAMQTPGKRFICLYAYDVPQTQGHSITAKGVQRATVLSNNGNELRFQVMETHTAGGQVFMTNTYILTTRSEQEKKRQKLIIDTDSLRVDTPLKSEAAATVLEYYKSHAVNYVDYARIEINSFPAYTIKSATKSMTDSLCGPERQNAPPSKR